MRFCALIVLACCGGCSTLRTTDPQRTATEQMLMTQAVSRACEQLSALALRDKLVWVDEQYVKLNEPEQAYLMGELRARLLESGVRLVLKREQAKIVLEVRSGGVGVDRLDYLLGLPAFVLGASAVGADVTGSPERPTLITPEIAIVKNIKQQGYASVAFVAYWAETGELVTASGPFTGRTLREDYWLFGTGPRTVGNIPTAERRR
jgi:hypothetical protein